MLTKKKSLIIKIFYQVLLLLVAKHFVSDCQQIEYIFQDDTQGYVKRVFQSIEMSTLRINIYSINQNKTQNEKKYYASELNPQNYSIIQNKLIGGWNLFRIIFLYTDNEFSRFLQIFPQVRATDIGLIAYFEGDCPDGWLGYESARGKFILSLGDDASIGSTGGEATHILKVEEMPSHNHNNGEFKFLSRSNCLLTTTRTDSTCGEPDQVVIAEMLPSGQDQPHNNMPPYIILRACQKKKDSQVDLSTSDLVNYVKKNDLPSFSEFALQADIIQLLESYATIQMIENNTRDVNSLRLQIQNFSQNITNTNQEFSLLYDKLLEDYKQIEEKKEDIEKQLQIINFLQKDEANEKFIAKTEFVNQINDQDQKLKSIQVYTYIAIAGLALSIVAVIILVGILVFLCCNRNRTRQKYVN